MPGYVTLFRWTDDGMRTVKDTVTRARESMAMIEKAGKLRSETLRAFTMAEMERILKRVT